MLRACSTPLDRCFQDLSNGILQAPQLPKIKVGETKKKKLQSVSNCKVGWSKGP
jgi:hypothetical protein